MHRIVIPTIGAAQAWRHAARTLLAADVPPSEVIWGDASCAPSLFSNDHIKAQAKTINVSRRFISMANTVVWHRDPQRFARLYEFLWRVRDAPHLMDDHGDREGAHLRRMEKNVRRCKHKMKAFVRFREIGNPASPRRSFAAWFEPTHYSLEPTTDFFMRRFGDMDWRITTPEVTAQFVERKLILSAGQARPELPDDAHEDLWIAYFQSIFNPARLKVSAMQSEMPKKYWHNLPEAVAIPDLVKNAHQRAQAMADAAPTLPPLRAEKIQAQRAISETETGPFTENTDQSASCKQLTEKAPFRRMGE